MTIPIFRPYVFLRCKKCHRKTEHVLLNTTDVKKGEVEETYECQQCGEIKIIYELTSLSQLTNHVEA
jgi:protein-arginine kinase activator protein McsA